MWHICKRRIGPSNSGLYWIVTSSTANQVSAYEGPRNYAIGHCDATKKAPLCCHDDMMCCCLVYFCYNVRTLIFNCDIAIRKTWMVFINEQKASLFASTKNMIFLMQVCFVHNIANVGWLLVQYMVYRTQQACIGLCCHLVQYSLASFCKLYIGLTTIQYLINIYSWVCFRYIFNGHYDIVLTNNWKKKRCSKWNSDQVWTRFLL